MHVLKNDLCISRRWAFQGDYGKKAGKPPALQRWLPLPVNNAAGNESEDDI